VSLLYHITTAGDWQQAKAHGAYTGSTRGRTLQEEGFIHASTAEQVDGVANAFYTGERDLIVLVIDEQRVHPEVIYEVVIGSEKPFPHIYGPLNVDAVVGTVALTADPEGHFTFVAP
jgi:uncharacterized protein (DUF952 family)